MSDAKHFPTRGAGPSRTDPLQSDDPYALSNGAALLAWLVDPAAQ